MGCCDNDANDVKYSAARQHEKEFTGPIGKRSCTDVICCLIFTACILALLVLSVWAFAYGDYRKLIYPTDSDGELCGVEGNKGRPKLLFFDLLQCVKATVIATGCLTPQVCVKNCPDYDWYWMLASVQELKALKLGDWAEVKKLRTRMICLNEKNGMDVELANMTISDLVLKKICAPYVLKSSSVLDYCMPSAIADLAKVDLRNERNTTLNATEIEKAYNTLFRFLFNSQVVKKMLQDLVKFWRLIFIMFLISAMVSLLWIILLRFLARIIIWLTLVLFFAIFGVASGYSFNKFVALNKQQKEWNKVKLNMNVQYYMNLKETWLTFGIVAGLFLLVILIILIFLRTHVRIAIALINEASNAVGDMMLTLIWPFVPFLMQLIIFFYCVLLAVYLTTASKLKAIGTVNGTSNLTTLEIVKQDIRDLCDPTQNVVMNKVCQFVKYEAHTYILFYQFYTLFMLFWLLNFVKALGQMTLAGAFASYYFAFTKPKDIPKCPIFSSFWRCLRYHLGTLALGSLLIALCQLARVMLEYIDGKTREGKSLILKFVMKCMTCCLWCFEMFLKFLTKNAYIMTAIYGQNFCSAAKNAFSLIFRNCIRVVVVSNVTDFLLFIGKLCVAAAMGGLAYGFFDGHIAEKSSEVSSFTPKLHYFFIPVVIVVIGTYVIANLFFGVYSMAVDTLFLCFLEDLERNDGSQEKPFFMSESLLQILGKKNKSQEQEKSEKK